MSIFCIVYKKAGHDMQLLWADPLVCFETKYPIKLLLWKFAGDQNQASGTSVKRFISLRKPKNKSLLFFSKFFVRKWLALSYSFSEKSQWFSRMLIRAVIIRLLGLFQHKDTEQHREEHGEKFSVNLCGLCGFKKRIKPQRTQRDTEWAWKKLCEPLWYLRFEKKI